MPSFICTTCGVGFSDSAEPPAHCPVCEDERQYVNAAGQSWTTLAELQQTRQSDWRAVEPGLFGLGTTPTVGIGQRALVVAQPNLGGGVMWDCTPLISDRALDEIAEIGGVRAIAISHPHFYSTMVDWSHALGGVPIYLHESNREFVMRPDPAIAFWAGDTRDLGGGITLIRTGGHFTGSTVLHWAGGADDHGVLMTGDSINVVPDARWVSFMYSYPNLIPLNAAQVTAIVQAVAPYSFERLHAGWWDKAVASDASAAVRRSADRYLAAIK
jgi:glyoxylase-like metal-dependent hydrolase (beta-lactamase superfamily II)